MFWKFFNVAAGTDRAAVPPWVDVDVGRARARFRAVGCACDCARGRRAGLGGGGVHGVRALECVDSISGHFGRELRYF